MAVDDLNRPLGVDRIDRTGPAREIPWNRIGLAGIVVLAGALGVFVWITDDGMGGQPYAVARIERTTARSTPSTAATGLPPVSTDVTGTIAGNRATGADVEAQSGVKVVRQGDGTTPGALVIQIPNDLGIQLNPSPDQRLVERNRHGLLPRIGADGAKPLEVYARPLMLSSKLKSGAPRIALVVGGMGLNRAATQTASDRLPGEVTLGFAPYGADLEKKVAQARETGHEVILQLPMESFEGARETPGPHTLLTDASVDENLDNLRWLMSRFTGYVGVANFLGGKFTADERSIGPVLREAGGRGLAFFDDGTSARTLAPQMAPGQGVAFRAADVAIDIDPRPEAIDAALNRLESIARQKGSAVGSASGLPATVDRIARFAKSLEGRGIALAPLSALAQAPPSASARAAP